MDYCRDCNSGLRWAQFIAISGGTRVAQDSWRSAMECATATLHQPPLAAARVARRVPSAALGGLFVLIWSSGYVAGKIALEHAGAFSLLEVRFAGAALAFALLTAAARPAWPGWRPVLHSAVVGLLS